MDPVSTATTRPTIIVHAAIESIFASSTIPDADIPAPLGEHGREEITAEIDLRFPSRQNLRVGPRLTDMPVDRRLQEI